VYKRQVYMSYVMNDDYYLKDVADNLKGIITKQMKQ